MTIPELIIGILKHNGISGSAIHAGESVIIVEYIPGALASMYYEHRIAMRVCESNIIIYGTICDYECPVMLSKHRSVDIANPGTDLEKIIANVLHESRMPCPAQYDDCQTIRVVLEDV